MITVVNYGMGNLNSVVNALKALFVDVCLSDDPADLARADRLVLPGVGAFGQGMDNLRSLGLVGPLTEEVMQRRKPFLGICLGMELLARDSYEHGHHEGLGWVAGTVKPFDLNGGTLKATHIGWNDVRPLQVAPLFTHLGPAPDFYFVHQYYFHCDAPGTVAALSEYGSPFPAALKQDNILAVQFHPEKSQETGLALLRNFVTWQPGAPC